MTIFFNVAQNGKHVFRTDVYANDLTHIQHIEVVLKEKFPPSEGYSITRYERPDAWTTTEVTPRISVQESK